MVSLMLCVDAYDEKVVTYPQERNGLKYEVNQEEPNTSKLLKYYSNGFHQKFVEPIKNGIHRFWRNDWNNFVRNRCL